MLTWSMNIWLLILGFCMSASITCSSMCSLSMRDISAMISRRYSPSYYYLLIRRIRTRAKAMGLSNYMERWRIYSCNQCKLRLLVSIRCFSASLNSYPHNIKWCFTHGILICSFIVSCCLDCSIICHLKKNQKGKLWKWSNI